jgi:hypothetical protein
MDYPPGPFATLNSLWTNQWRTDGGGAVREVYIALGDRLPGYHRGDQPAACLCFKIPYNPLAPVFNATQLSKRTAHLGRHSLTQCKPPERADMQQ